MKFMEQVEKIARNPEQLRKRDSQVAARHQSWYQTLAPVLEAGKDLPFVLIKGDVLSLLAYGETGYRDSHDIDLLVPPAQKDALCQILIASGFNRLVLRADGTPRQLNRREQIMLKNSHQDFPFYKQIGTGERLEVDINTDVYWGEYEGPRVKTEQFLSDRVSLELFGYRVKTLSVLHQFIEVCLHHYKEMNAPYIFKLCNPINSRMFEDIYCLYARYIKGSVEAAVKLCEKYQVTPYVYYMLHYTGLVFSDPELEADKLYFRSENGVFLLNRYGLAEHERKVWKCDFLTILDAPEIYSIIEPDLTNEDKRKIETVWSVFS